VQITLEIGKKSIVLIIEDDGVGFNSGDSSFQPSEDGGFGLLNIKERVELLKGAVKINSEINKGTQIYVSIPNEE
jgi:two-component system sensor histidine kinase DegS